MPINDPDEVRKQYAEEGNLETRSSVWRPDAAGRDPATSALAAVRAEAAARQEPVRLLEVGCGPGGRFALRLQAEVPGLEVVAIDQSPRFVELAVTAGVDACLGDVQDLPFGDASFDVVTAMWMLYHVADLDRGLRELSRVLRPGGLLVAVTNGDSHLADLREEAGGRRLVSTFSSENGGSALARHFSEVAREDFSSRAVFADHAQAMAYLRSSREDVEWELPWFDGPREYAGASSLFTARR